MAAMTTKRAYGQYATPIPTADYMVRKALAHIGNRADARVLDPAVGDGVFVDRLLAHGLDPGRIFSYDIDESVVRERLGRDPNIRHQDFLLAEEGDFDVIIGNPPYKSKRESLYIKQNKERLAARFGDVGMQNLYAMFVCQAVRSLKEGGLLVLIIQDSFLTNVYYQAFRRFVLDHCLIHEILLAPRRLFHHTDADVRTAIVTLEKCAGPGKEAVRSRHRMRLVDRLQAEEQYERPPAGSVQEIEQSCFERMEKNTFFINVPDRIVGLILGAERKLGGVVSGGTGISTGHDARFLRRAPDVPDAPGEWVPFYKNGGANDAWYYETPHRIHRDWQSPASRHRDFLARNTSYYFREGITCSSMGVAFSAAYMPEGCLFGVNANLFAADPLTLHYVLALLNSSLAKYMIRAVFNRTNMVTAGYVKRLPYIEPPNGPKRQIADLARRIVERKKADPAYDFSIHQAELDRLIYAVYGIDEHDQGVIASFCRNMLEAL